MMVGCAIYVVYFARWDIKKGRFVFSASGNPLADGHSPKCSLQLPNLAIYAIEDGFRPDSVEFSRSIKSDFMERSTLLRPIILLPSNFDEEVDVDLESVHCRIAHDIAHTYYRDYVFLNAMLIAVGVCIYSFIFMRQVTLVPGANFVLSFVNGVFLILLIDRLRSFFHLREYRADLFAYGLVGDKYVDHLAEMKKLEACFVEPTGLAGRMKSLTHPSFAARFERLKLCSPDFANCPWFAKANEKSNGHTRVIQLLCYVIPVTLLFAPFQHSHASMEMGMFQELDLRNKILIYLSLYLAMLRFQGFYEQQIRFYGGTPNTKNS